MSLVFARFTNKVKLFSMDLKGAKNPFFIQAALI